MMYKNLACLSFLGTLQREDDGQGERRAPAHRWRTEAVEAHALFSASRDLFVYMEAYEKIHRCDATARGVRDVLSRRR
jgi:hypothetical protein